MRGSDPSSAAYADCHRNFIFSSTWPFVCLPTPFFPFFFHYSLVSSTTSLGFRWTASHVDLFSLSNFSLASFPSFSLNDSLVTDGLDNRTLTGWTVNIYIYISGHCDDQFLPNFLPEGLPTSPSPIKNSETCTQLSGFSDIMVGFKRSTFQISLLPNASKS